MVYAVNELCNRLIGAAFPSASQISHGKLFLESKRKKCTSKNLRNNVYNGNGTGLCLNSSSLAKQKGCRKPSIQNQG